MVKLFEKFNRVELVGPLAGLGISSRKKDLGLEHAAFYDPTYLLQKGVSRYDHKREIDQGIFLEVYRDHGRFIERLVGRRCLRVSPFVSVDEEDVLQFVYFGIMKNIARGHLDKPKRTRPYLGLVVSSLVVDYLRKFGRESFSRRDHQNKKKLDQFTGYFSAKNGREPFLEEKLEFAQRVIGRKFTEQRLRDLEERTSRRHISFDSRPSGQSDGISLREKVSSQDSVGTDSLAERSSLRKYLDRTISTLHPRDQYVLAAYFFEGLSQREIGERIGVTESRANQLLKRARIRMRARLEDQGIEKVDDLF